MKMKERKKRIRKEDKMSAVREKNGRKEQKVVKE